jgi:hypothetical protein
VAYDAAERAFELLPGGSHPVSFGAAQSLIKTMNICRGEAVWEIGCGVPVLAAAISSVTCKVVLCTDIDPVFKSITDIVTTAMEHRIVDRAIELFTVEMLTMDLGHYISSISPFSDISPSLRLLLGVDADIGYYVVPTAATTAPNTRSNQAAAQARRPVAEEASDHDSAGAASSQDDMGEGSVHDSADNEDATSGQDSADEASEQASVSAGSGGDRRERAFSQDSVGGASCHDGHGTVANTSGGAEPRVQGGWSGRRVIQDDESDLEAGDEIVTLPLSALNFGSKQL